MKQDKVERSETEDKDMRPEYDFRGAERGKHYKPLHQGYTVYVHNADGATTIQHFKLEEGTILLQPDVREYFPDSEAVNAALRSLITLMDELPKKKTRPAGRKQQHITLG